MHKSSKLIPKSNFWEKMQTWKNVEKSMHTAIYAYSMGMQSHGRTDGEPDMTSNSRFLVPDFHRQNSLFKKEKRKRKKAV